MELVALAATAPLADALPEEALPSVEVIPPEEGLAVAAYRVLALLFNLCNHRKDSNPSLSIARHRYHSHYR